MEDMVCRRIKAKLADPIKRKEMLVELLRKQETIEMMYEYRQAEYMAKDYKPKSKSLWIRLLGE